MIAFTEVSTGADDDKVPGNMHAAHDITADRYDVINMHFITQAT